MLATRAPNTPHRQQQQFNTIIHAFLYWDSASIWLVLYRDILH
jgi:hypothetical protein